MGSTLALFSFFTTANMVSVLQKKVHSIYLENILRDLTIITIICERIKFP